MSVQAFGAELAVERFDKAIVSRFAGPREVQRYIIGIGPQIEIAGDEFAVIVHANGVRIAEPDAETAIVFADDVVIDRDALVAAA